MAPTEQNEYPSSTRVVIGMLTIACALLVLLSLTSYDWRDIYLLRSPPNYPANNWIGPLGAWTAFITLNFAGIGAYVIPAWLLCIGTLLIFYRRNFRKKALWLAISLTLLAAVIDLHGGFHIQETYNLAHEGGLMGWLITHGVLIRWLSTLGTGLILWSLLSMALVMTIGPHNVYVGLQYLMAGATLAWEYMTSKNGKFDARNLEMEKEARMLRREQARLQKELRKKAKSEKQTLEPTLPEDDEEDLNASAIKENTKRRVTSETKTPSTLLRKRNKPKPPPVEDQEEPQEKAAPLPPPVIDPEKAQFPNYNLPPIHLLNAPKRDKRGGVMTDNEAVGSLLIQTLDEFGISAEISSIKQGPVVTRYEISPARGVRVERIAALSNNLALALKAHSLRVQAPVPGKGVVGIEVPNETAKMVVIRDIIESDEWRARNTRLPLVLGKDVGGKNVIADLAKMPHLLVAGATGAGKSVCINAMLSGLFMCKTPDELRLILVDPKIVEFSIYNDLPHLVVPVITDPKKVSLSLRWAINEMEKRYKMFAKARVRNIEGFNNRHTTTQGELFAEENAENTKKDDLPSSVPYIVIVIDELADLMLAAGAEIENSIARLAQLSRAVGIHMIIATQRPSVNVITGTIKANFPARIAFQVAQKVDSRTILDQSGADKLLGQGDMLYLPPASSKLIRAQGAMITDDEVDRIVSFMKEQAEPSFEMEIKNKLEKSATAPESMDDGEDDELIEQAINIIRETQRASTSSLQRRMRIGYTRAARIIDILEERGIVGPPCGAGPREILIDLDAQAEHADADMLEGNDDFDSPEEEK